MRVFLVTLGDPGKLTGGYLYHRRLAERAAEHDAEMLFASFPELAFPLPALYGGPVLRRVAHADVVVLDSIAAAFGAPWLGRLRLPPLAAIVHQAPGGIDHGALRTRSQAALDRQAYEHAVTVMAASEALAEDLRGSGVAGAKITVIPPGRDVAREVTAPSADLRAGRAAALLCVANWIERKGILSLLEALALLPAELATLHLAGDDNADPRYARRVRRRLAQPDVATRVVVHGALTTAEVAGMYAAADVFVLPSTAEPYGTVYGEAMAAGLPVVGFNAGNLPHLARSGVEGLIVAPGDTSGLAAALGRLCEHPELRAEMGRAARARAQSLPTWSETAASFFGSLRKALR